MLGNYILHFPLTDFAVSLLAVAALVDIAARLLARTQWESAVDWLLFTGFAGTAAAVGSGLWLVSASGHPHDDTLSLHHKFAYGTLATATIAVAARLLQRRITKLAWLRTVALAVSALLVSCAGYVGGKMSHGTSSGHSHEGMGHEPEPMAPTAEPPPTPQGSAVTPSGSAAPAPSDGHSHSH